MKREVRNLPEFIKLIERYETITLEEIEKKYCDRVALTGNGRHDTCSLCVSLCSPLKDWDYKYCNFCIYGPVKEEDDDPRCLTGWNKKTYDSIAEASYGLNPEMLLKAYRNRAKHLRRRYAKFLTQ